MKASSSVLFSLVLPDESLTREEEIALLRRPEALWTVLVVNGPPRFIADDEPREHLSPIAQYLRGITACLSVQKHNADTIFDALQHSFKEASNESLFDDELFSKSKIYHWIIEASYELCESITSSTRFIQRLQGNQIRRLVAGSHDCEKFGAAHWEKHLGEEVYELDELQARVQALRTKVHESVRILL
jgi:hypothetical protein